MADFKNFVSLQRYFASPLAFRSRMATTDAIISGEFALNFFERSAREVSHLAIYVEDGQKFERMCKYLRLEAGYKVNRQLRCSLDHLVEMRDVMEVWLLRNLTKKNGMLRFHSVKRLSNAPGLIDPQKKVWLKRRQKGQISLLRSSQRATVLCNRFCATLTVRF